MAARCYCLKGGVTMAGVEVLLTISDGSSLSATGSEEFVTAFFERYLDKVLSRSRPTSRQPPDPQQAQAALHESGTTASEHLANAAQPEDANNFGNVFDIHEGEVSILATLPGSGKASKTKSLVLLYLLAKEKMGEKGANSDDIKAQAQHHACYDGSNFSKHLKGQPQLVIVSGEKGSSNMSLRLTHPGRKEAEELAEELQNEP